MKMLSRRKLFGVLAGIPAAAIPVAASSDEYTVRPAPMGVPVISDYVFSGNMAEWRREVAKIKLAYDLRTTLVVWPRRYEYLAAHDAVRVTSVRYGDADEA